MSKSPLPRLRWRPTRPEDLDECLDLFPAWLPMPAPRAALRALWCRLLEETAVTSTVMEDLAQPAGQRVRGWGAGMVLDPAWARAHGLDPARLAPAGPVSQRLYAALLAGDAWPPADRALGEINARGQLQFHTLHYTQRPADYADDYALAILNVANDAFRVAVSGWWLQAQHMEASAADLAMMSSAGFPFVRYADAAVQARLDALPEPLRPAYFGIGREAARRSLPGTSVRHGFEHTPPRFRLSASQRRLLWLALFDDSDESLMQRLQVSVHGLKKLWRGIYERIADVQPDFFGDDGGDAGDDGRRGPEKRRQVLAYVRQRPEELRPWVPT